MQIKTVEDIRKYYPDLLAEYRAQVLREAREKRANAVRRLRRLFELDEDEGAKEPLQESRNDAFQRLLALLSDDEEGNGE